MCLRAQLGSIGRSSRLLAGFGGGMANGKGYESREMERKGKERTKEKGVGDQGNRIEGEFASLILGG